MVLRDLRDNSKVEKNKLKELKKKEKQLKKLEASFSKDKEEILVVFFLIFILQIHHKNPTQHNDTEYLIPYKPNYRESAHV